MKEPVSSTSLRGLLKVVALRGLFLRMFPDCSTAIMGKISEPSLKPWGNSGMAFRGEYLTLNTLEHPKGVVASTLSQVIEASAPEKYFLSPEQVQKFLDRVSAKATSAPDDLRKALESQASMQSSTPQSGASRRQAHKLRVTETMEKPTRLIAEEVQTLYARRMMPSECEKLQGFPPGWTAIATER